VPVEARRRVLLVCYFSTSTVEIYRELELELEREVPYFRIRKIRSAVYSRWTVGDQSVVCYRYEDETPETVGYIIILYAWFNHNIQQSPITMQSDDYNSPKKKLYSVGNAEDHRQLFLDRIDYEDEDDEDDEDDENDEDEMRNESADHFPDAAENGSVWFADNISNLQSNDSADANNDPPPASLGYPKARVVGFVLADESSLSANDTSHTTPNGHRTFRKCDVCGLLQN
jgi:hypothetical protein